jgi:hypothetical protein
MATQNISIKYTIEQLFACKDANCLMPQELESYCNDRRKNHMPILNDLIKPMDDITKSHSHGVNPNDVTLMNMIRDNLNKVNHSNYDIILRELKSLNYTCENHFVMLASELIIKSMNDVLACKGMDNAKREQKTTSEIYMSIACEFSNYQIKQGESSVKFKYILVKECQRHFEALTDKRERMDQNNPHRVSNYRGFMNMIGLMYSYGLFNKDVVKTCFSKIIRLIKEGGLPHDDCDNYYSGYERLMNRILKHFEKTPIQKHMLDEFVLIKDILKQMNDDISKICEQQDDKKSKVIKNSDATTNTPKALRMFSVMTHRQNINRYNELCEVYKHAESDFNLINQQNT